MTDTAFEEPQEPIELTPAPEETPAEVEPTPDFISPLDIKGDPEVAPDETVEAEVIDPAVPAQTKAELIASFFPEVGDIDGQPFDETNPEHVIIAAYLVGAGKLLRRL